MQIDTETLRAGEEAEVNLDVFGQEAPHWGIPAPYYFRPEELSERAQFPETFNPEIPELHAMAGTGQMILALYLNETGAIDRVEVESTSVNDDMKALLVKQFSGVRLRPGYKDGVPVASRVRIEVTVLPLPSPAQGPGRPIPAH